MKPIFRWIIGNTSNAGYECLAVGIQSIIKIYGEEFQYYVCYNHANVQKLREIIGHRSITLINQSWDDCPIPVDYEQNQNIPGGSSLWKLCPSRLDAHVHEIISDNDIVFIRRLKEIDQFLKSDKILLVEDPIKFQGKFRFCFKEGEKYNAGLFGLPPHYDFENALKQTWEENGSIKTIDQSDEQGLTTATLKKSPFIKVSKENIKLIHSQGSTIYFGYNAQTNKNNFDFKNEDFFQNNEYAYHFTGINKLNHLHWEKFKTIKKKRMLL